MNNPRAHKNCIFNSNEKATFTHKWQPHKNILQVITIRCPHCFKCLNRCIYQFQNRNDLIPIEFLTKQASLQLTPHMPFNPLHMFIVYMPSILPYNRKKSNTTFLLFECDKLWNIILYLSGSGRVRIDQTSDFRRLKC